jgi:hypothetical protein
MKLGEASSAGNATLQPATRAAVPARMKMNTKTPSLEELTTKGSSFFSHAEAQSRREDKSGSSILEDAGAEFAAISLK